MKISIDLEDTRKPEFKKSLTRCWILVSILSGVLALVNALVLKQFYDDKPGGRDGMINKFLNDNEKLIGRVKPRENIPNRKYQHIPCPGCGMG